MKKKIILADDDIDELNMISGILVKGGYDIILSENGNDLEKKILGWLTCSLLTSIWKEYTGLIYAEDSKTPNPQAIKL